MNSPPSHAPDDLDPPDGPPLADTAAASDADAERARRGDRPALERLVVQHQPAVARLLWRFARSPADLEDLVQETFLRMVRGLPDWRAEQPFHHWLLRIATNVGRDYFRRQAVRARWQHRPASVDEPLPDAVDPAPNPAARAAASEAKAVLAALAPDQRTLLTLHHLEGWSLPDIARQFGWTVAATKLRAWRARRQLRALLENSNPP